MKVKNIEKWIETNFGEHIAKNMVNAIRVTIRKSKNGNRAANPHLSSTNWTIAFEVIEPDEGLGLHIGTAPHLQLATYHAHGSFQSDQPELEQQLEGIAKRLLALPQRRLRLAAGAEAMLVAAGHVDAH